MGATTERITVNDVELSVTHAGEGPAVLFLHGFPELAHSWRHQIEAIAAAGYHAISYDARGYGDSTCPPDVEDYTIFHLTGDAFGVLDHFGHDDAVVVGHDWGSMVAAHCALFRPDRLRGVVFMSVPFSPRGPMSVTTMLRSLGLPPNFYILYFQEDGVAEGELDPEADHVMRRMLWMASGSAPTDLENDPLGNMFLQHAPEGAPPWMTDEELVTYVQAFEKTGFRGGINWYRNFDRNWELTAPWAGAYCTVPSLFIGGLADGVVTGMLSESDEPSPMVTAQTEFCTDQRGIVLQPGIGHWNQQEDPTGTNEAILEFLSGL